MKRKILNDLIEWNNSVSRKPLIVWGARQVGKTYLVKELFAESFYKDNYIYIDFKIEDEIRDFCYSTANAEKIIEYISLIKGKKIDKNVLLIFDEVQECPNVVSALKYFCQDFRDIPVIATGSMVRIKIHRVGKGNSSNDKFLFPVGKINQITMYPMNFEEFLLNINEVLYNKVKLSYEKKEHLEGSIHELVMDYVYKYLLIGGMPEVVSCYLENGNLLDCGKIINELYDNYLSDMELYQASSESIIRTRNLFNNIYNELNRESKNFSPSLIEEKSKTRNFVSSIDWLCMTHIVNQSFQLKEHISLPLIKEDDFKFRLFLGDIGMFSFQSGINASSFISKDRENSLSGIFFENFVANELVASGNSLYYWKGKRNCEIEFIVESNNKIYPIDVKKGRGSLNSLEKYLYHNKYEIFIKVSSNNYGYDNVNRILTIPFYYVSFIFKDLKEGNDII